METIIPHHECTEEDWAEFPSASKGQAKSWEAIVDNPDRGFFCADWSEDRLIYGNERSQNFQLLEILMVPCNYMHYPPGDHNLWFKDAIDPECIADRS